MKLDFCVSHNYTQRDLLLLLRPTSIPPPPPPSPQNSDQDVE
jgi:hypothetical protein